MVLARYLGARRRLVIPSASEGPRPSCTDHTSYFGWPAPHGWGPSSSVATRDDGRCAFGRFDYCTASLVIPLLQHSAHSPL